MDSKLSRTPRHRRTARLGLVLAALLGAASCGSEPQEQQVRTRTEQGQSTAPPGTVAEQRDNALVRTLHAIPGAPPADLFAGETKIFDSVAYKTVTPYREVADDDLTLRARNAGSEATASVAEQRFNFEGGLHYTVIALPPNNGDSPGRLLVLADNLAPPPEGKARVRAVQASPDAGELDVYLDTRPDALFSGLGFEVTTAYIDLDPASGMLEICPEDSRVALFKVPGTAFEAGKQYTIFIVGNSKQGLDAVTVEDQLVGSIPAHQS